MNTEPTLHAGSLSIQKIDELTEQLTPEQLAQLNIEYTGSPTPNRAQRRAAEKRLRRARRNQR